MEKYFAKWIYSISPAEDLAKKVKIDQAYLLAIGGTEGLSYSEVPDLLSTLEPPESQLDSRAYKIHAHILGILAAQGCVETYFSTTKPTEIVARVVEASKLAGEELRQAIQEFPSGDSDFCDAFEYIRGTGRPVEILEFTQFSLWRILLEIYGEGAPLRRAFVETCLKRILATESGLSKPGYFNWGLVFGDEHGLSPDTGEEIIITAQVEDDGADDEDDTGEKNPFSTAAFDMDDVDNEDSDTGNGPNIRTDAMDSAGM